MKPDDHWQEMYEERAAIMEYDGGMPRKQAEWEAGKIVAQARLESETTKK